MTTSKVILTLEDDCNDEYEIQYDASDCQNEAIHYTCNGPRKKLSYEATIPLDFGDLCHIEILNHWIGFGGSLEQIKIDTESPDYISEIFKSMQLEDVEVETV